MRSLRKALTLIAVIGLSLIPKQSYGQSDKLTQSDTPIACSQCVINFGMAGITRVQTMRVNLVEVGDVPPGPCRQAEIVFLNGRNAILARSAECVGAGQAISFDLNGASMEGSTNRSEVRVVVRLAPPPDPDRQSHIVATVEVIDNQTGKTSFMVPEARLAPANDFAMSVSPSTLSLTAGGSSGVATVSTSVTSGAAQSVSLSISGLPAGASAAFNPPTITAGNSSTVTISTTTATPSGNYLLTITGTGTSATHATPVPLTVN